MVRKLLLTVPKGRNRERVKKLKVLILLLGFGVIDE